MPARINQPKQVKSGQVLTAEMYNRIVEDVLSRIQGGYGVNVRKVGRNRVVELSGRQIIPKT